MIQSDIARRVADSLGLKLLSGVKRNEGIATESAEAHTLYLKGRYSMNKISYDGLWRAIDYLKMAIKKDPNYALAYSALSECYIYLGGAVISAKEGLLNAKESALKAIELVRWSLCPPP